MYRGGKRLLTAAVSGLAMRLQLTGWVEDWAEGRYKALFSAMDLTRDFYYSHSYDSTHISYPSNIRKCSTFINFLLCHAISTCSCSNI